MQHSFLLDSNKDVLGKPRWSTPTEFPDLSNVTKLALDTETDGKNNFKSKPVGISIAYNQDNEVKSHYFPFGHSSGNMDPDRVYNWLISEMFCKDVVTAGGKFDVHMLRNWRDVDLESLGTNVRDIQFGAALLDDSRHLKVDLNSLGMKYCGQPKVEIPKDWMSRMAQLPADLIGEYAEHDARLTLLVDQAQQPLIKQEGLERVLALENSIIPVVCEIERNGCRIDIPRLEQWQISLQEEYEACIYYIYQQTGILLQPNSPASLIDLCGAIGIKPPEDITASGKTSFKEQSILDLGHPMMTMAVKARKLANRKALYVDKYLAAAEGDIIRSQFHQLKTTEEGTISGRFSSSGGGDDDNGFSFNAQQVQKRGEDELATNYPVRAIFIPDEGLQYWACDAMQIEYRLFGHFARAPKILEAYRRDPKTDFHQLVMDMVKPLVPNISRTHTKNINFARLYGAGLEKIALMLGCSETEAQSFLNNYDKIFPEANRLLKATSYEAKTKGFVSTALGRRARFGAGTKIHSAINRVIQGTAADYFKLKMRTIYDNRHSLGITKLRQIVHDEMCGDRDPDPKYNKLIQECFDTQELKLGVPLLWDCSYGSNWKAC
jgi:DNA polymerase-1